MDDGDVDECLLSDRYVSSVLLASEGGGWMRLESIQRCMALSCASRV